MNPQQIHATIQAIQELFPQSWVNDWLFTLGIAKCLNLITFEEYLEIRDYLKHTS